MFKRDIPDAIIKKNNERILSSLVLIMPEEIEPVISDDGVSQEQDGNALTSDEIALLWDIHNRPFIKVTERYKTINLGG